VAPVWLKKLGLTVIGGSIRAVMMLVPKRVRVMVVDRGPFVHRLDYSAREILLHVDSEFEYKVRACSVIKEPGTCRWIESFRPGDVFYDVGANVGAYTLVAAKYFDGQVRVYAFEPSAVNFSQLLRNLALNNCGDTVMPLPIALAEATRPEVFNYRSAVRGAALHSLGAPTSDTGPEFVPAFRQRLLAYSLDDAVDRYELEPPSHIKIDVDGGESRILAGARRTLAAPSLRTVLIEASVDAETNRRIEQALIASGFTLTEHQVMQDGSFNFLFERALGAGATKGVQE